MTTADGNPINFMHIVGAIVLAGVAIYFLFMAIDSVGLKSQTGTAKVLGKESREPGLTYASQPVGGRMLTRIQTTPGMCLLMLDVDGRETLCAVSQSMYDAVESGDEVRVEYRQRRLLRSLQVDDLRLE